MTTSRALLDLLRGHYIKPNANPPGGILVEECGLNGAFGSSQRCDALYVGFTSSSGRLLIGHEVKVSRADWRRELAKSDKADLWADNCHEWWIVAPPDVVPLDELPAGWGLLLPPSGRSRTRMTVAVKATRHADRRPSWTVVRSIMARLDTLQSQAMGAYRQKTDRDIDRRVDVRVAQQLEARGQQTLTPQQRDRLYVLDRIEQVIGEPLSANWDANLKPEVVGAALNMARAVHQLPLDAPRYVADHLRDVGRQLVDGLDAYEHARLELLKLAGPVDEVDL